MYKLNNKGFTLMEVLAVIVIIAILGMIAVPNVLNSINTSKQASYDVLVKDITIAGKQLIEEIDYAGTTIYHYDNNGKGGVIHLSSNEVNITLQSLVSNGFLTGSNNPDKTGVNKNDKIIINPKDKEDIGDCEITITKTVDASNNYNTSYELKNKSSSNNSCPTDEEYKKALN